MQKQKIGWIGLGVMGYSMASNLLKSDYELYVFTRTKKAKPRKFVKGEQDGWTLRVKLQMQLM